MNNQGQQSEFSQKKKIRIAYLMGTMRSGGIESVVMNDFRRIDKNLFSVDFFTYEKDCLQKEEIEKLGGKFYLLPSLKTPFLYIKTLTKLLKENKYDIAHAHMNTLSFFSLYAAKKAGISIRILHNHSTGGKGEFLRNIIKKFLKPLARKQATEYVACSSLAGKWMYGKKAIEKGNVKIFLNAVDENRFSFKENVRIDVRKELGIENKFVIGHIGRMIHQKNHQFLLKVFSLIQEQQENSVLLLIGEGKLKEEISLQASSLGISDKVIFLGLVNDPEKYYQAFDCALLPSFYEGLPVVAVEEQAADLPCVLSDNVTRETKILKDCIFLPLKAGAEEWAKNALSFQHRKRQDVSYLFVNSKFSLTKRIKNLEKYYTELINHE